jgi:hypothetical protein
MTDRWQEFFEGDDRHYSMSRLLLLGSFLVTSFILIILVMQKLMTEGYFGLFIGIYSGTYITGKAVDARTFGNQTPQEKPTPPINVNQTGGGDVNVQKAP